MAFEKFWEEKQAYDANKALTTKMVLPDPSNSPLFNHAILFKTIEDRDSMTDTELRYFIHHNFQAIMNNTFDKNVSGQYINAFRDTRFLDAFNDVLRQVQYFDPDITVRINLIIYHYLSLSSYERKQSVEDRMMVAASIVNASKLVTLKKYNMPSNLENCLLIARYSDFNLNICVRRVDLILNTNQQLFEMLDNDGLSEASTESVTFLAKLLVDLFPLDEWIYVLPYFMLDVLPDPDENNETTQWITPDVETMDSTLNLAVLQVLDTMIPDSNTLRGILVSYAEGYRIMNSKKPIRFSFRSISYDYPRLKNVINYLENEEHIYVP